MKSEFTNTNVFGRPRGINALLVLGFAVIGLTFGASTFKSAQAAEDKQTEPLEHLQRISHDCFLLRELPAGQDDSVRLRLGQEIINEIRSTERCYPAIDPSSRRFAQRICEGVVKDVSKNPDRYLCASPELRKKQLAAWKALLVPVSGVISNTRPAMV